MSIVSGALRSRVRGVRRKVGLASCLRGSAFLYHSLNVINHSPEGRHSSGMCDCWSPVGSEWFVVLFNSLHSSAHFPVT